MHLCGLQPEWGGRLVRVPENQQDAEPRDGWLRLSLDHSRYQLSSLLVYYSPISPYGWTRKQPKQVCPIWLGRIFGGWAICGGGGGILRHRLQHAWHADVDSFGAVCRPSAGVVGPELLTLFSQPVGCVRCGTEHHRWVPRGKAWWRATVGAGACSGHGRTAFHCHYAPCAWISARTGLVRGHIHTHARRCWRDWRGSVRESKGIAGM